MNYFQKKIQLEDAVLLYVHFGKPWKEKYSSFKKIQSFSKADSKTILEIENEHIAWFYEEKINEELGGFSTDKAKALDWYMKKDIFYFEEKIRSLIPQVQALNIITNFN